MANIVVQTRGKDFLCKEKVLRKSDYFQNLFEDSGVVSTMEVDVSSSSFKHILKHLEDERYIIPPECYLEQDFFLLNFIKDKIVVKTDTSYHYLEIRYRSFFPPMLQSGKLINLSSITDDMFISLREYLCFGIRPKKYLHIFEAYGINIGYESIVYYVYSCKVLLATYETDKLFRNYGVKIKTFNGSPESIEQATELFNKLNKNIKVNNLDKQSRELFEKLIKENKQTY
jgi:hypothetical protein